MVLPHLKNCQKRNGILTASALQNSHKYKFKFTKNSFRHQISLDLRSKKNISAIIHLASKKYKAMLATSAPFPCEETLTRKTNISGNGKVGLHAYKIESA